MTTLGPLLLAAAVAAQAPAEPAAPSAGEQETVLNVRVVAEGAPMAERRVARGRPFHRQSLYLESDLARGFGIQFELSPQELDALRDRHDMSGSAPFVLAEWIARTPGSAAPSRHLAFLHCSLRLVTFVGAVSTCLRDSDDDGRLDGVVTFAMNRFPAEGLRFEPIAPVAYRYVQRERAPLARGRLTEDWLGLAFELDRTSGRLLFYVDLFGPGLHAGFKPSVEVDPARLPATIELGGAELTVLAWDGRRATVRVDRPFPARPVRLIPDQQGRQRGWRLEYIDEPLPD